MKGMNKTILPIGLIPSSLNILPNLYSISVTTTELNSVPAERTNNDSRFKTKYNSPTHIATAIHVDMNQKSPMISKNAAICEK
ncbi:hypothetical protein GCM10027594_00880 [Hymenobacter agri]